jgi:hypothetical protein
MTRGAIFVACRGENDYFVADYWRILTFVSARVQLARGSSLFYIYLSANV